MAWLSITFYANARVAESLADALIEAGALSVSCDDADAGMPEEAPQFAEPGEVPARPWQRNLLTALVHHESSPAEIVTEAAIACGIDPPEFETLFIEDEDWVRRTQLQFEPMRITDDLWIVPSWCEPPDPTALNISIDPGLAFGTGSHPTTRLVLRWLTRSLSGGETVLDYGCGSGILAIAASRLGARDVTGVDIDPQAIVAAHDNAAKNGVQARFCTAKSFGSEPSDIVVANILANPLIEIAPLIRAHCTRQVALSGILEAQADEVAAAYAADFAIEIADREEGWVLLAGMRR